MGDEVVVNAKSEVCVKIKKLFNDGYKEEANIMAKHAYMLAIVASRQLTADELKEFIDMNIKLLEKLKIK
jgi:hypothetical protein